MIINENQVPFLTHNEFRWLDSCNIGRIYDFSNGIYYVVQFIDSVNCTTEALKRAVPEWIRQRVRNKNLILVIGNFLEAFHGVAFTAYEKFVVEMDLPEDQVLFLSHSPNILPAVEKAAAHFNKKVIKTVWTRSYEHYAASVEIHNIKSNHIEKINRKFDKKFVCLNRRWRPHRAALVGLLESKGLLSRGHVSLGACENGNWDSVYEQILNLSDEENFKNIWQANKEKIFNIPHLYVDTDTLEGNVDTFRLELQPFYDNTFFSVITETNFYTSNGFDNNIHLSEKTFKVVTQRHPFLLVNNPYALSTLRQIGYKTFSPFIDESYDTELNDAKRLLKIVGEIERLCSLEGSELNEFILGVKDICEHNYQNLIRDNDVLGRYCTNLN